MKPCFTWVLGQSYWPGYQCFNECLERLMSLYGDSCDYCVLQHQSNIQVIREFLGHKPVKVLSLWPDLVDVEDFHQPHLEPVAAARVNTGRHEIFLYQGIVLNRRLPEIDWFLGQKEKGLALKTRLGPLSLLGLPPGKRYEESLPMEDIPNQKVPGVDTGSSDTVVFNLHNPIIYGYHFNNIQLRLDSACWDSFLHSTPKIKML